MRRLLEGLFTVESHNPEEEQRYNARFYHDGLLAMIPELADKELLKELALYKAGKPGLESWQVENAIKALEREIAKRGLK